MFDNAANDSIRGSFRVDGPPTTGDPDQECPRISAFWNRKERDRAMKERYRHEVEEFELTGTPLNSMQDIVDNTTTFLQHVRPSDDDRGFF